MLAGLHHTLLYRHYGIVIMYNCNRLTYVSWFTSHVITWAFPYWPGYHPETPILAQDTVDGQYGPRDDNQANMEMPMY
jgi:hypothetical protein